MLLALLVALVVAALFTTLPDEDREGAAYCAPRKVASWSADELTTGEFTRYGNDASRTDDWTGGDGTHSVRLPDGRVLWLFSDTYLGQVNPPPNLAGQPHSWRDVNTPLLRNSGVVMSAAGRLEQTLPAPMFPDPAAGQWRWPVAAKVEARSPGADEQVVRVVLWTRENGTGPWIYGVPVATEVATLSLPDLRVEDIVKVSDQSGIEDPARRVLYGTTAVDQDGYTYVFGGSDEQATARPASAAHLARVPDGRLAEPGAWEYWDGSDWDTRDVRSRPVLGNGGEKGVGSAFTVVRDGSTWVLLTMAAGTEGLTTVTSYWACSPSGPWYGPTKAFTPPLPHDSAPRKDATAYNPQAHPALGGAGAGAAGGTVRDGQVLLSYDVNWLDATPRVGQSHITRNVDLYRPRFARLKLGPAD
ncbi:DUF4185 domain-containing protein [Streptomyces apocyni]|uniref:DUF4185 domain-containing protein n=1 Tax=Streptomyces apocyni TaxID=2654677 RepID=UPI0012E9D6F0|nr:DUF4185 domain-containing protein [Streptomyces apocyni]